MISQLQRTAVGVLRKITVNNNIAAVSSNINYQQIFIDPTQTSNSALQMARGTNNLAFTVTVNPQGATPILTRAQLWAGLLLKIREAETFVRQAIQSTKVLSEETDNKGNLVVTRDVLFRVDQRMVREVVTVYDDCRIEFLQPDGSKILNLLSHGSDGGLYLTFVFEWRHAGVSAEELEQLKEKETKMGMVGTEGTIAATRELVVNGKL